MFRKNYLFGIVFALIAIPNIVLADTLALKQDHPDRYTVVTGDTLWDISERFLKDPWLWPEIWHINPDIDNPHLIYPDDVVYLTFVDGKPVLRVEKGKPTIKLSPQARATRLGKAITTIPLDAIKQFLSHPRVLTKEEIDLSAYVVSSEDGHLISTTENKIYARDIKNKVHKKYKIYRIGEAYRNPGSKKKDTLGYEAFHVADAKILAYGDPATLLITDAKREVLLGDRLLPVADDGEEFDQYFLPHAPDHAVDAQIISVLDGVTRIAQHHIVVLNKGTKDNMEQGHVMTIYQSGIEVKDNIKPKNGKKVQLPEARAGSLMVVRPFDRVSYALVMEAEKDIHLYDSVRRPWE